MLDADNLFLRKTDELFQCGQFCAVFINPCIFHTGLFVLQVEFRSRPSSNLEIRVAIETFEEKVREMITYSCQYHYELFLLIFTLQNSACDIFLIVLVNVSLQPSAGVFKDMLHQLEVGKENPDGADQGFISGYFPDLLDRPMFHPPANGTKLDGNYRLPLGYQMDASYYCKLQENSLLAQPVEHINLLALIALILLFSDLRLRWNIPCGPNSVITFPGAPWLKPWYWWSWPVLPLGISWHEQRRRTLG